MDYRVPRTDDSRGRHAADQPRRGHPHHDPTGQAAGPVRDHRRRPRERPADRRGDGERQGGWSVCLFFVFRSSHAGTTCRAVRGLPGGHGSAVPQLTISRSGSDHLYLREGLMISAAARRALKIYLIESLSKQEKGRNHGHMNLF